MNCTRTIKHKPQIVSYSFTGSHTCQTLCSVRTQIFECTRLKQCECVKFSECAHNKLNWCLLRPTAKIMIKKKICKTWSLNGIELDKYIITYLYTHIHRCRCNEILRNVYTNECINSLSILINRFQLVFTGVQSKFSDNNKSGRIRESNLLICTTFVL